jgi:hypothetical protein
MMSNEVQNSLVELARESGAHISDASEVTAFTRTRIVFYVDSQKNALSTFADKVRAEERERCAKECDAAARRITSLMMTSDAPTAMRGVVLAGTAEVCHELAASIRASGDGWKE